MLIGVFVAASQRILCWDKTTGLCKMKSPVINPIINGFFLTFNTLPKPQTLIIQKSFVPRTPSLGKYWKRKYLHLLGCVQLSRSRCGMESYDSYFGKYLDWTGYCGGVTMTKSKGAQLHHHHLPVSGNWYLWSNPRDFHNWCAVFCDWRSGGPQSSPEKEGRRRQKVCLV